MFLSRVYLQRVRGVSKVDLDLKEKNLIIGPNGSGKSTIVDCIGACLLARRSSRLLLGPSSLIYIEGVLQEKPFWVEKTKSKTLIHYGDQFFGQSLFREFFSDLNIYDQGEQVLSVPLRDRVHYFAETFGVLDVFQKIQSLKREVFFGQAKEDESRLRVVDQELDALSRVDGNLFGVLELARKVDLKKKLLQKKAALPELTPDMEKRCLVAKVRKLFWSDLAEYCPVCLSKGPFEIACEDPSLLEEALNVYKELQKLQDVDPNLEISVEEVVKRIHLEKERELLLERKSKWESRRSLAEHLNECFLMFIQQIQREVETKCSAILRNYTRFKSLTFHDTGIFVDNIHARGLSFGERALVGSILKYVLMTFLPYIGLFDGVTDFLDPNTKEQLLKFFSDANGIKQILLFTSDDVGVKGFNYVYL